MRKWAIAVGFAAIGIFAAPTTADAAVFFFQFGEEVFETGPLPSPYAERDEISGAKAAYKCQVFSVFWTYIHRWDCEPVAVRDGAVIRRADPEKDQAMRDAVGAAYAESSIALSGWAAHGKWALLGVFGLFFLVKIMRRRPY